MNRRNLLLLLAFLLFNAAIAADGVQKPRWTPVDVDYSIPPGLKVGDEVTTVFTLTATDSIPRLEVRLDPLSGIEWLDGDRERVFETVDKGQQRTVRARVKVTATRGEVALAIRAIYGSERYGHSVVIKYPATVR